MLYQYIKKLNKIKVYQVRSNNELRIIKLNLTCENVWWDIKIKNAYIYV